MFKPSHLKNSVHFRKGVEKFVHYKRHLLGEEQRTEIRKQLDAIRLLEVGRADRDTLTPAHKTLEEYCRQAVPAQHAKPQGWLAENVDVLFTAIVIALGIRAYFLQPFKIPTGSMQPTLNGVISKPVAETAQFPSLPVRAWEWLFNSRSYTDIKAEQDDAVIAVQEKNLLLFFTSTKIQMRSGKTYSVPGTKAATLDAARERWDPLPPGGDLFSHSRRAYTKPQGELFNPVEFKAGETILRVCSQGGDQLLVDKMSYHFRKPKRGEVFVFSTKGIKGIESGGSFRPEYGSQHYIKRLCAVPGDMVEIHPDGQLIINGKRAEGEGFEKVMSKKNGYNGYIAPQGFAFDLRPGHYERYLSRFWKENRIPQPIYLAFGDNQENSADSRAWGPVPQVNLAGPALLVYWPFGNHFGFIR